MMDPNVRSMAIQAGIQPPADYHGDETADCPWIATDDQLQRFADMLQRKFPPWVDEVYDRFQACAEQAQQQSERTFRSRNGKNSLTTWLHIAVSPRPGVFHPVNITLDEWQSRDRYQRIALILERGKP